MAIDWTTIRREIEGVKHLRDLTGLTPVAMDSLWGSLWELNHRYTTVRDFGEKHGLKTLINRATIRLRVLESGPPAKWPEKAGPISRQMGLGTYGWKYDHKIIAEAVRLGVDVIDTAEGYGYGRVEAALGASLLGVAGPEIASKVSRSHMSHDAVYRAGMRSFARLGRAIHYQIHFPNASISLENTLRGMVLLRKSGKVHSIGMSNVSVDLLERAQRILTPMGESITSVQLRYCLGDRRIEGALLPYCRRRNIRILAYSPLGQDFSAIRNLGNRILRSAARSCSCVEAQVALAWLWSWNGIVPIPRTNQVNHLRENMESRDIVLPEEWRRQLEVAFPTNN